MAQASPSSARGTERGSWSRLPKALAARFDSILALKEQPWYSFSQLNRPPSFPKPHYVLYARLNALTRRRPTRWPPAQRDCWAPFQLTRQAAILFRKCRDNFMKRARKGSKGTSHPKLLRRASVAATISQMGARIRSDRTGDATAMISVLKPVAVTEGPGHVAGRPARPIEVPLAQKCCQCRGVSISLSGVAIIAFG